MNRSNQSLGNKVIQISMYDSDRDRMGTLTSGRINMNAKTGGDFSAYGKGEATWDLFVLTPSLTIH